MTSELTAIKTAYEQEDMSPEQIAESQELDITAVKAGLMQCSSKYRKACGTEDEDEDRLNFTNDQLSRVNDVIVDLALGAEDEHLRFKAAAFIRDDKKGRRDVVKGMSGNNFNILFINKQLERAREVTAGIKQRILGNGHSVERVTDV
jgi:hypothetical protein